MVLEFLSVADCRLAYQRQVGNKNSPGILFLSGFASDMDGTKATFLSQRTAANSIPFIRFDYRGCGKSGCKFTDGNIGTWLEDSLAVFDNLTQGPQIVVGSSMGGWLGLLLAKARPERVKAYVGIAPAPDFTEELMWKQMTPAQRESLVREGAFPKNITSPDRPLITLALIEEARQHLVLDKPLDLKCPVRLLQGMKDEEVPWTYVTRIAEHVSSQDLRVTLVKNGDHSLSRPQDLELLWCQLEEFLSQTRP